MGTEYENPSSGSVHERESLLTIFKEMFGELRYGEPSATDKDKSTLTRYRSVVGGKVPRLQRSVKHSSGDLMQWMHRGGAWRSFFILTTGLITLVGLSGVFAFLVFLVTATFNAVIVALLGTVAAVGAVTALFFAALATVYVGALVCATVTIGTIVFFTGLAVLTAAGWIGFWWLVWLGMRKAMQIAQGSLALTATTIQSFSNGGQPLVAPVAIKTE